MNSFIETLNQWGESFLSFAWPMLWQSSLLIAVLIAFEFLFRRKVRASVRYALWLVVLVKLCVPPTLALPTSPAWWLHKTSPPVAVTHYTVTYDNGPLPEIPQSPLPAFVPPKPAMTHAAWLFITSTVISSALLLWLLARWWHITRQVRRATCSERLITISDEAQKIVGMKSHVEVKLTTNSMSPAVCGLFRPTILIPQSLVKNFSDERLRAVLLHELIHLRRRDVWLNFLQSLLQIVYWWHPLVWLANARIRRVREEAVDDAVMLVLRDEAESYAPTLLEVAKLALNRPLASLGLVGILESRSALRQRIERLVDFRPPRKAGLTLVSLLGILAFTAVAVPMGQGPEQIAKPEKVQTTKNKVPWPDPNFTGYKSINLQAQFLILDESKLRTHVPLLANNRNPVLLAPDEVDALQTQLRLAGARYYNDYSAGICQPAISGAPQYYRIGGGTNQFGSVACLTTNAGGSFSNIIAGFDIQMPAKQPDWTPMNLTLRAMTEDGGTRCRMDLAFLNSPNNNQHSEIVIPNGGALVWAVNPPAVQGECQVVMLIPGEHSGATNTITAAIPKADAGKLIRDATDDYEMGKLDEAEKLFKSALALDSENVTAKYYLGLVQSHQMLVQTSPGREIIFSKLERIRLDSVSYDGLPLSEVIRDLSEQMKLSDPDENGINFLINPNVEAPVITIDPNTGLPITAGAGGGGGKQVDINSVIVKINPPLTNVSLGDVLDAIVQAADHPITYSIEDYTEDYTIVFSPKAPDQPQLYTRYFRVDPNVFFANLTGLPNTNGVGETFEAFRKFLANRGVNLNPPENIFFSVRKGLFYVRATVQDLDTIEKAIVLLNDPPQQMTNPVLSGVSDNMNQTNLDNSTAANVSIRTNSFEEKVKADRLVRDAKVDYEMGKLDEAEMNLKAAIAMDSNNQAAQYYLNLVEKARHASKLSHANNPFATTNLVHAGPPGREVIFSKLKRIRLDSVSYDGLPLSEVIRDLSKQIKLRDPDKQGINFLINPNVEAPVIITAPMEENQFGAQPAPAQIDPNTGLPITAGGGGGGKRVDINSVIIEINPPLTNVSLADVLDAIVQVADHPIKYSIEDYAIVFSPKAPDQPQLYTRTFRVDRNVFFANLTGLPNTNGVGETVEALRKFLANRGVNLDPPKNIFFNDRLGELYVRATLQDLDTIEKAIQSLNEPAPQVHIKAWFVEVPEKTVQDLIIPNLLTNGAAKSETNVWSGLIANEKFKTMLRMLEAKPGFEILAVPEVTSSSGRQTRMRATQIITVITNSAYEELTNIAPGATGILAITPQTNAVEIGPLLDVVPVVLADGYTINLTLIPTLTDFDGYQTPPIVLPEFTVRQVVTTVPPAFTVRQVVTTVNIWDNQTVVIGGLVSSEISSMQDKVPLLGDLPLLGKLFQSQTKTSVKKNLMIFVTATIVDPAGNRVHSDDELPFAQSSLPLQPPGAGQMTKLSLPLSRN